MSLLRRGPTEAALKRRAQWEANDAFNSILARSETDADTSVAIGVTAPADRDMVRTRLLFRRIDAILDFLERGNSELDRAA